MATRAITLEDFTPHEDSSVDRKNRRIVEYVLGRLGPKTTPGQCILHIAPGGAIAKVEWRETQRSEDILAEE